MIGKSPAFRSEPSESSFGKRSSPPTIPSHFINFGKPISNTAPSPTPSAHDPFAFTQSVQVPTRSSHPSVVSYLSTADQTTFHKYDPKAIDQATKFCKHAVSALQYQDVVAATDNLKKALNILATLEPS